MILKRAVTLSLSKCNQSVAKVHGHTEPVEVQSKCTF